MNIKQLTLAAIAVTTGAAMAAMPEVSNVTMTQAANRLVTITYQLADAPVVVTLDIQTNANTSAAANTAYNWPADPNPSSFLGKLRTKTGLDFDLPAEAQWEFAARAGNGDTKWGDGSGILNTDKDANLDLLGRNERNGGKVVSGSSYANPAQSCGAMNGTAIVGSYAPNSWGIYDMHGNQYEYCLDWYEADISSLNGAVNIDPENPLKTRAGQVNGSTRVRRGGAYHTVATACRSATRNSFNPANADGTWGFRVVCRAGLK